MTLDEYKNFWLPVRHKFLGLQEKFSLADIKKYNDALADLIGVKSPGYPINLTRSKPEFIRYLKALAGPHGHTILKMRKIQNENR